MPSRAAVSTISRTESMPARWPSTRGRCRCAAHRPLPSMMMATCAGSRSKFTWRASASSGDPGGIAARSCSSDMQSPSSQTSDFTTSGASGRARTPRRPERGPPRGAVRPARARSPPASTSAIQPGGRRPTPTSTSVPTIFLTMWRRNPLPDTSTVTIRSLPLVPVTRDRVERPLGAVAGLAAGPLEGREVVKPLEGRSGFRHGAQIERWRRQVPRVRPLERTQHRRVRRSGSDRSSARVEARVKFVGHARRRRARARQVAAAC